MSEYDAEYWRETEQVLDLPNKNPYRTGIMATTGIIFTMEEAREYLAMKSMQARKRKKSYPLENAAAAVLGALVGLGITVAALI